MSEGFVYRLGTPQGPPDLKGALSTTPENHRPHRRLTHGHEVQQYRNSVASKRQPLFVANNGYIPTRPPEKNVVVGHRDTFKPRSVEWTVPQARRR